MDDDDWGERAEDSWMLGKSFGRGRGDEHAVGECLFCWWNATVLNIGMMDASAD